MEDNIFDEDILDQSIREGDEFLAEQEEKLRCAMFMLGSAFITRKLNMEIEAQKKRIVSQAGVILREQAQLLSSPTRPFADDDDFQIHHDDSDTYDDIKHESEAMKQPVITSVKPVALTPPITTSSRDLIPDDVLKIMRATNERQAADKATKKLDAPISGDADKASSSRLGVSAGVRTLKPAFKRPVTARIADNDSIQSQDTRIMAAKLRTLQEEMDRGLGQIQEWKSRALESERQLKESNDDRDKLNKRLKSLEQKVSTSEQTATDKDAKLVILQQNINELQRKLNAVEKSKVETAAGTAAVKDVRALEEVEKYRNLLKSAQDDAKKMQQQSSETMDEVTSENKKLKKQKTELLAMLKKQMRLIEMLKKQKIHLEAARLLQFTEEEFRRVLELGQ